MKYKRTDKCAETAEPEGHNCTAEPEGDYCTAEPACINVKNDSTGANEQTGTNSLKDAKGPEKMRRKGFRSFLKCTWRFLLSLFLLAITFGSVKLFEKHADMMFPAYRKLSRTWIRLLAWIHSILPVAVWDYLVVMLVIAFAVTLVISILKRSFFSWLQNVILTVSLTACGVICGWMLNHYAPELRDEIGLSVREYSVDELYAAAEYYLDLASEYAVQIPRDADDKPIRQNFEELAGVAGRSYTALEDTYEIFRGGSKKPVKKLSLYGEILMYQGNTGIFMPATGEACVPESEQVVSIAFTMCHEAAHRLGIADEEEANFAAFLACDASDDVRLKYSGYYLAYIYCENQLARKDRKRLNALNEEKSAASEGARLVLMDADDAARYYQAYESPLEEVATKTNDTYLKTFSEEKGVESYGAVVDELIAWYLNSMGGE